jgi:hypothetical protein
MVTSSTAYANYPPNLSRFVAAGMSLAAVAACAIMLYFVVDRLRAVARHNLLRAIVPAKSKRVSSDRRGKGTTAKWVGDDGSYTEQLEFLLRQADLKGEGAFGLLSRQPLVWAVIVLAGGFGWTILIGNGLLPGL